MSCNCPDTNKCPTPTTCLCGFETNIYNPSGVLVETVTAYPVISGLNTIYEIYNSTAFQAVLGQPYTLTIAYNTVLDRWEVSYFNDTIDEDVVIGVYATDDTGCPVVPIRWSCIVQFVS